MSITKKSSLKDKFDFVFSLYIRLRDSDENGVAKCITCDKHHYFTALHCGHFHSRRHFPTRWDEHNCAAQCVACNLYNQGKQERMEKELIKRFGENTIKNLDIRKNNTFKASPFEYQYLIDECKDKITALGKDHLLNDYYKSKLKLC